MELIPSWEQRGIDQGISQGIVRGKEALVMRLLRRRFGGVSAEAAARLERLSPDQLDDLGEAPLDLGTAADLDQWLSRH